MDKKHNNKKQLLNNIDLQKMKKNSIENSIIELKNIVEEKNKEIKDLNLKINSIINENSKNEENNNKEKDLSREDNKMFNDFFREFITITTNYYIESVNKKNSLYQIQAFPNYSILDPKQKKLFDIIDTIKIFINHINSITNQLMSMYNSSRHNTSVVRSNHFNNINNSNSNENNELKKKVKEMSDLLVQSNYWK